MVSLRTPWGAQMLPPAENRKIGPFAAKSYLCTPRLDGGASRICFHCEAARSVGDSASRRRHRKAALLRDSRRARERETIMLAKLKAAVVAALGAALLALPSTAPAAAGAPVALPGLDGQVRVVRDAYGVPHVYAKSDHDAYFMVGYLHAHDRLFQMDQSRRQASGTLAELLGPGALA